MEAFYKRHGFRKTKGDQAEPEESEDPDVGAIVPVDAAAEVTECYAMSDGKPEDEEDGEGAGAAASDADDEAAAAADAAPEAAAAAEAAQA